jgi:2-oxoglutarate ferredoxin oxidoreductase subunit gamma
MASGFEVTYLPAYGVEVRGGTAHSMIKISSLRIGSPVVTEADTAIILNGPSFDKFESSVKRGGLLILNTSLSGRLSGRKDIEIVGVPLTEEAIKLGNAKVANIMASGVFMERRKVLDMNAMVKVIEGMAGGRKELAEINIKALERGMELGKRVNGK